MQPEEREIKELKVSIDALILTNERLRHGPPLWRSFLVGTLTGIGATVGAALIIALLAAVFNSLAGIDILKPLISPVLPYIDSKQSSYDTPTDTSGQLPTPVYETTPVAPAQSPLPSPSE